MRLSLPRLPQLSYVPIPGDEDGKGTGARTKFGFAPTYSPSFGVQSLDAGVGPVPRDPEVGTTRFFFPHSYIHFHTVVVDGLYFILYIVMMILFFMSCSI